MCIFKFCYGSPKKKTIKTSKQTNVECFICFHEYTQKENIVLLHGKKFKNHNICNMCYTNYNLFFCPICNRNLN